jgi:hypothetical protein
MTITGALRAGVVDVHAGRRRGPCRVRDGRAKSERWNIHEVSAFIATYRSQAESIDGVFDGRSVISPQEIREFQVLIRA